MSRVFKGSVLLAGLLCGVWPPPTAEAQSKPADVKARGPNACNLLTKDEVRKHLPWPAFLDKVTTVQEEAVGAGSACEYPSVRIQVLPMSPQRLDAERKKPGVEAVAGLGDEAFFVPRVSQYAELYVRVDKHVLTLQAGVPTGGTVESIKPAVANLAKALVARLR